ncbi:AmmeMemoRadiSam system protein A [Candidatus Bipolaricaulota bacterium]|nr:AmmeMemoRadiSam system protein A [Candidatus Bipolaricaulota bacterium]
MTVNANIPELLQLTEQEQEMLLDVAREALTAHVQGGDPPAIDDTAYPETLRQEAACFVTLTKDGRLRGCILDRFEPHESVLANVARNVLLAASHDPRFSPVRPEELDRILIEVSILGLPYELPYASPDDLLSKLVPGVDGVILTIGGGTSTFLPQVWEQIPEPADFLSELCLKQGAAADRWRQQPPPKVELYQVVHFSEENGQEQAQELP